MKFSENWLRSWVNPALSTDELAEKLAMIGLTVDAVTKVSGDFSNVVVGEIVTRAQHPNADKLSCCEVNVGEKTLLKIVCGAPNARAGIKVAVAKVGAVLPGDFKIKSAKLRGEPSEGMLCSPKELQLEMGKHEIDGILELPLDAPIGQDFREYFKANDTIFDVDITPNRGDALSIRGIARDLAAATQLSVHAVDITKASIDTSIKAPVVKVDDTSACPRFVARVIKNINLQAQTPSFMQHALQRANIRCINPVVDVTNYVMLELGQPMHAYDLSKVDQGLVVRRGKNEKIKLLDEQEITVTSDDLVIADAHKPLALAGIMGGMDSGVSNSTKDIVLEAAFFTPKNICLSKRHHHTSSESSHRFERGVDYENTVNAMERATQLIVSIVGGDVGDIADVKNSLPKRETIVVARDQIKRILGIEIADDRALDILKSLDMKCVIKGNHFEVTPPSFRFDMTLPIDIIEELARMVGYENIPAADMIAPLVMNPILENRLTDTRIRNFFVDRDYHEAVTYSFISPEQHALFSTDQPITLSNPMSREMSVMRPSILPGLLQAVQMNLNNQQSRVRLFEMGLCFSKDAQTPKLAMVITGSRSEEQWGEKTCVSDFFDLKADLESIFHTHTHMHTYTYLHPGRSCTLTHNGKSVGVLGEIHPAVLAAFDIKQPVVACELDLSLITEGVLPQFKAFSKFPSVRRDIAMIVDEAISAERICTLVSETAGELLENSHIFDIYQGKGIEPGKKSMALGLTFVHPSRTLRDEEIQETIQRVIAALSQELSATLRT